MLCPIWKIFGIFLLFYIFIRCPTLADRLISPPAGHRAENNLDQLDMAGPEAGGRAQKVVIPHPAEALVVSGDLAPLLIYIGMPGHQGLVVIGSKVMNIFNNDFLFDRLRNLR